MTLKMTKHPGTSALRVFGLFYGVRRLVAALDGGTCHAADATQSRLL